MTKLAKPQRRHSEYSWPRASQTVDAESSQHTLNTDAEKFATYSTKTPFSFPSADVDVPFSDDDIASASVDLVSDSSDSTFSEPSLLTVPAYVLAIVGRENLKPLLSEKLLWFCDELHALGGLNDDGAPLNIRFFRSRLSMKNKELVNSLLDLGIIELCAQYSANHHARRYRFTQRRNVRLGYYTLKLNKLIKKRGSVDLFNRARLSGAGFPMKLFDDVKQFIPSDLFEDSMNSYLDDARAKGTSTVTMEALRDFVLSGRHRFSIKQHRITNHIVGLPEDLRQHFTVNGQPVIELDLPNSHPSLLPMIFTPYKHLKDGDGIVDASEDDIFEHEVFTQLVRSGKFYEEFADCWERDKFIFLDYAGLGEEKTDSFLAKNPRKGVKTCWQVIFNGKTNPQRLFQTCLWTKFSDMFPCIAGRMAQYKRSNPRALGDQLRRMEAQMVASIASQLTSPCITLYDGFMCAEDAANELIEICRTETLKHLGFVHLPT